MPVELIILTGIPQKYIRQLQLTQNAAATEKNQEKRSLQFSKFGTELI